LIHAFATVERVVAFYNKRGTCEQWIGSVSTTVASVVPAPIAGLPGLIFASVSVLGWWRRRQKSSSKEY